MSFLLLKQAQIIYIFVSAITHNYAVSKNTDVLLLTINFSSYALEINSKGSYSKNYNIILLHIYILQVILKSFNK